MGSMVLAVIIILLFLFAVTDSASAEYLQIVNSTKIMAEIEAGHPVKYDHVLIRGNLNLSDLNLTTTHITRRNEVEKLGELGLTDEVKLITSPILIYDSKIDGNVNFNNALFEKPIHLMKINFSNCVNFKGSHFNETADFSDSQFDEDLYFSYSQFARDVNFGRSRFNKLADFRWSIFEGTMFKGIRFKESQFRGDAYFWGSVFNNTTVFSGSIFDKSAYFRGARFNEPADFIESTFNTSADFMGSKFGETADFRGARFNGDVHFWKSLFNGSTSFWRSQFDKNADFSGIEFNLSANFRGIVFSEEADFGGSQFGGNADFSESQFDNEAYFERTKFERNLNLTLTKYNKIDIRWSNIKSLNYDDSAYLLLIDNFKKSGFLLDANDCYYRYRIESRKFLPILYRPADWILMASYGYGTKPEYPLVWAILVIFVSGFFFYKSSGIENTGKPSAQRISLGDAFIFSAMAFTSGASALIDTSKELTPVGISRYVITLERLLGWVLFALFLTALGKTIID